METAKIAHSSQFQTVDRVREVGIDLYDDLMIVTKWYCIKNPNSQILRNVLYKIYKRSKKSVMQN